MRPCRERAARSSRRNSHTHHTHTTHAHSRRDDAHEKWPALPPAACAEINHECVTRWWASSAGLCSSGRTLTRSAAARTSRAEHSTAGCKAGTVALVTCVARESNARVRYVRRAGGRAAEGAAATTASLHALAPFVAWVLLRPSLLVLTQLPPTGPRAFVGAGARLPAALASHRPPASPQRVRQSPRQRCVGANGRQAGGR